jgi:hypothetical protein
VRVAGCRHREYFTATELLSKVALPAWRSNKVSRSVGIPNEFSANPQSQPQ